MCGGDVFINRNAAAIRAYTEVRKRTKAPVPVFGTGVLHPDVWLGREDGWVDRRKEWVDLLEELPVVGVRGPLSKAYLDEAGSRNVVVCGDPAVAYHAAYAKRPLSARPDGPLRVGINVGFYPGTGPPGGSSNSFVALALWLRKAGHQIQIIPAWSRDLKACEEVASRAGLDLSVIAPPCSGPEDFLAKIENLDLLVALNLHAGIMAAAANVPFVSLEYHPKCRDFATTLGWEEFLIRTDQLDPGILIELVSALMAQLDIKRTELCQRMCKLMNTFEDYCRDIEPLLLGPKK